MKFLALLVVASLVLSACQNPFGKKEPAGLQVTAESGTASVFLNGQYVNKTPYVDKTLKAGTYSLRLEPEDSSLAVYETSVTLHSSTLTVVNWNFANTAETSSGVVYEMEPLNNSKETALSIVSIPDSTIVKINGTSEGFTPVLKNNMTAGSHQFQVSLPSYVEQKRTVNIVEGYKMKVNVKLAKEVIATPVATDSAIATSSATATDSAQAKPTPSASPRASASPSSTPKATTSTTTSIAKPYVKILETPTGWLRVRAEASTAGEEVARVDEDETFPHLDTEDGWHQIEYEKGKKGWVSGQYVEVVK